MVQIIVCVILSVYIIYLIELPVQKRNVFYKVTRLSEKKRENLGVKNLKKEKNLMFIRWTYEWQAKVISVTKRRFAFTNQTVLCDQKATMEMYMKYLSVKYHIGFLIKSKTAQRILFLRRRTNE